MDHKIKDCNHTKKSCNVKRSIIPGNSSSLWKSAKITKYTNTNSLPSTLFETEIEIRCESVAERFANYFDTKIKKVLVNSCVDDTEYNGTKKPI
jgi:hypothetical protein